MNILVLNGSPRSKSNTRRLTLSPETIHDLQTSMMPKDEYIRAVNSSAPYA